MLESRVSSFSNSGNERENVLMGFVENSDIKAKITFESIPPDKQTDWNVRDHMPLHRFS